MKKGSPKKKVKKAAGKKTSKRTTKKKPDYKGIPGYFTIPQAARRLGIDDSLVRRYHRQGRFSGSLNLGKAILIPEDSLIEFEQVERKRGRPSLDE